MITCEMLLCGWGKQEDAKRREGITELPLKILPSDIVIFSRLLKFLSNNFLHSIGAIMAGPKYLTGDKTGIKDFLEKFDVRRA